jgi:hypothetical protein
MAVANCYTELAQPYKKLMKLWAGFYDADFSEHLGTQNDEWFDVADRMTYMKACADFLGLTRQQARDFHLSLKEKFVDFS